MSVRWHPRYSAFYYQTQNWVLLLMPANYLWGVGEKSVWEDLYLEGSLYYIYFDESCPRFSGHLRAYLSLWHPRGMANAREDLALSLIPGAEALGQFLLLL